MNSNETLGSLENPPRDSIDVILTNPPYVTQGSANYKKEILDVSGTRNGVDLRDYYDGCGLGVEALFLRYISKALKPGGRAFMIVPLGMLNRTEPGPKEKLLVDCNILASIQLPRNTFFNTGQRTYILILEKRRTLVDVRPKVFVAIPKSIGESLDSQRIPMPEENDLETISKMFVDWLGSDYSLNPDSPLIKTVSAAEFSSDDRWDVVRFWTDEELVSLGDKGSGIQRLQFIDDARENLMEISAELEVTRRELEIVTAADMRTVKLSDRKMFNIRSGTRITSENIRSNPGSIAVYSCFKAASIMKGMISEEWLIANKIAVEESTIVTVNANGASVGKVYVRSGRCVITDDVIAIEVLHADISPDFLAVQLQGAVAAGGFLYEAKLFVKRVKTLEVQLPIRADGSFDMERQRIIASAVKRFDNIRQRLAEVGASSANARIV